MTPTERCDVEFALQSWVDEAVREANKSLCLSKRGVVIVDRAGTLLAKGHNHQPFPFQCNGSEQCKRTCGKTAVHAEQSAILAAHMVFPPGTSMLHVKAIDGKPVASMAPSCLECSKLILESGIGWMHLLHDPSAQMLPGATVAGTVDGKDGSLQIRCYSAQHFHWLTAEYWHRIDLRILQDGLPNGGSTCTQI